MPQKNASRNASPCHSLQQSRPADDHRGHSVCSGGPLALVGLRVLERRFCSSDQDFPAWCASSHALIALKGGFGYETDFHAHPRRLPTCRESSCAGRQRLAQYWVLESIRL